MLGWDSGVVDHALKRRVGPSSTRPRLKSRERGRVGEGERGGEEREAATKTLARRGDLREAQRKRQAKEGTLATRGAYARQRGRREGDARRGKQRRGERNAEARPKAIRGYITQANILRT